MCGIVINEWMVVAEERAIRRWIVPGEEIVEQVNGPFRERYHRPAVTK
jgi:hypothetical protein